MDALIQVNDLANRQYLVGMPQLSLGSLSENWLLKECGNLHWAGIADANGLAVPEFVDIDGHKLYAAFTALRVRSAAFRLVKEHSRLLIQSRVARVSPVQHVSKHGIVSENREVGTVELISVFVRRRIKSDNRTVVRGTFKSAAGMARTRAELEFSELSRSMRRQDWSRYRGFLNNRNTILSAYEFTPCPSSDFNGADFLYFAQFQQIIDRACWGWSIGSEDHRPVMNREIFFYGNLNLGEKVLVTKIGEAIVNGTQELWCQMQRSSDSALIADVFLARSMVGGQRVRD